MSDTNPIIIVKNAAHAGYRRAGLALQEGENRFDKANITDAQLAQLKADPRLAVIVEQSQASASGHASGAVDGGSNGNALSIAEAIMQLDPSNEAHFTKSGKPELKALSTILGRNVTGAERDDAWSAMQEATDAASGE
ncbi:HI1506-related protein [Vibrio injensis]|uniref:HI1506-related protein n=1 Tax=Vibrio injensis TaxID=1307414 RepID=UPI0009345A27|nr:HI1506-related protein [Vibrio injensis]